MITLRNCHAVVVTGLALAVLGGVAGGVPLLAMDGNSGNSDLCERIQKARVFRERILWVGSEQPPEGESSALWNALEMVTTNRAYEVLTPVEDFVK